MGEPHSCLDGGFNADSLSFLGIQFMVMNWTKQNSLIWYSRYYFQEMWKEGNVKMLKKKRGIREYGKEISFGRNQF